MTDLTVGKSKIVVKLQGGLGNQMFQYACGRALALRHGIPLQLDVGSFPDCNGRVYELHRYHIAAETTVPMGRIVWGMATAAGGETMRRVLGKASNLLWGRRRHQEPCSGTYDERLTWKGKSLYLDGYWQSERYFSDVAEAVRCELSPKVPLSNSAKTIQQSIEMAATPVSVHFRRGDYADNPQTTAVHGLCTLNYYHLAIDYVKNEEENLHLFVFSDEPEWVAENFSVDVPMTIVPAGNPGHEDLYLMSRCRHHIIANSSFSWWGAWLNPFENKIVCAPERWFADETRNNAAVDIVPGHWHRVPSRG